MIIMMIIMMMIMIMIRRLMSGSGETGGLATVNTSLNNTASIDQERASELLTEVRTCPQSVRIINFNQPISRTHKRLL